MASGDSSDSDLIPVSARAPQPEQRLFGRFTLKRVLGRGGMGIVWLASDEELQRNVAMKFLPDMLIRDPDAVKDLKRETRRSLDLTHHHIVRIYDFIQDDSSAAIVMEYVDGESLSGMKSKQPGGCFSVSEIANWVAHFCMAMDYAHNQARVVHRDLKPANLMLNSRSELKVTDFGISRSLSDSMTRVSLANNAGTLAYMSPEQALGSPPAPADDIYAFGATLYDLLTGRPPFFRGNLQIQLETVMPPPLMQRRKELENTAIEDIPADWEEVIMACLSKRPEDRPATLGEVGHRLGVLGTTGSRQAPHGGTGDTSRILPIASATPTSQRGAIPDEERTVGELPAEAPRSVGKSSQTIGLRTTTLEDILSHGVERPPEPVQPPTRPTATAPTAIAPTTPVVPPPSSAAPPSSVRVAAPVPASNFQPPTLPVAPTSSPDQSVSAPTASPSRGGTPWLWIGVAGFAVVLVAGAIAWPKKNDSKVISANPTPAVAPTSVGSDTTATSLPASIPVQPTPEPMAAEIERHASAAARALDENDLQTAKSEIAVLQQKKADHANLAMLSQRYSVAERAAQEKARQASLEANIEAAQKAIDGRDIARAREAIGKAAAIQDDARIASLRASLAKLETPPATPSPAPAAPAPAPKAVAESTEPATPKPIAATRRQTEPTARRKEERREEPAPVKRSTPRPVAQTPPEPRATPKPASQTQPPSRPQPPPRKVFSIPGS